MTRAPKGIFVGLSTLDVVQLVDQIPAADEKVVARAVSTAAGGPAANAAVAFAALGGVGRLVTRVGADPAGVLVRADLVARHLELINSADPEDAATTVVTALITAATGERAVVSAADHGRSASALARPADAAGDRVDAVADGSGDVAVDVAVDVVLVDSYETDLSLPIARRALAGGVPVILDCGSKKPQTESQLPHVSVAVVSQRYLPSGPEAIAADLRGHGVPFGAITAGDDPIIYWTPAAAVPATVDVPKVPAVDTLGAGDFFHGALAFALASAGLRAESFPAALRFASEVAAISVQHFGTRGWLARLARETPSLAAPR